MIKMPKTRNENIVVQEMENEILIYDLQTNKAFCLNETSAIIWQMCDGTRTVAEISQTLTKKLKQPITEDVVWLALDGFKKDNLLEESEQFEINFNGLSRRQVVRNIGLASLIMLPLVSSVVAPNAAMAASGPTNLAFLAPCSSPGECSSGNCAAGPPNPPTCCVAGATRNISPGIARQAALLDNCANYPTSASVIAAIPFPSANCCSNSIVGTCINNGGGIITLQVSCI